MRPNRHLKTPLPAAPPEMTNDSGANGYQKRKSGYLNAEAKRDGRANEMTMASSEESRLRAQTKSKTKQNHLVNEDATRPTESNGATTIVKSRDVPSIRSKSAKPSNIPAMKHRAMPPTPPRVNQDSCKPVGAAHPLRINHRSSS